MIKLFIALFGFWTVMPVGNFVSFPKRIAICFALCSIGFSSNSLSVIWWERDMFTIIAESLTLFLFGSVLALPFLILHQLVESAIESLEIIRGVSLSSVLSPLTDQQEIPLVVLLSCAMVSFLFIGSPFYFHSLKMLFIVSDSIAFDQLPSLYAAIEITARTFCLYPSIFFMIAAAMLTSDIALQIVQKIFPVLVLQDFGFLFRTANALILLLGIFAHIDILTNELLQKTSVITMGGG